VNDIPKQTKAGTFWAWVPAGLLASMLLGLGTLAYIAIDDPGFALEPNYYEKAVQWDRSQAEARESQALGFRLAPAHSLMLGADGGIEVELELRDRQGRLVSGAELSLEAFPNAAARKIDRAKLHETSPGTYRARLRGGASGLWELRCQVAYGTARFQQVLRLDVSKGRT
jgi:hypothetical protein